MFNLVGNHLEFIEVITKNIYFNRCLKRKIHRPGKLALYPLDGFELPSELLDNPFLTFFIAFVLHHDIDLTDIDFLSLSAHKLYGPKGIGALYCKSRAVSKIDPIMPGGNQEEGLRSGTVNVPGAIGLGAAAEIAKNKSHRKEVEDLTKRLLEGIRKVWPRVQLNGPEENRLLGNLNLTFPGVDPDDLEMALEDVAYSNSSSCSSGDKKGSYVLEAIGLSEADRKSSIRLGVGLFNTEEEIDQVIAALSELK